jgi:rapamycin-insensitive companion of mTOR
MADLQKQKERLEETQPPSADAENYTAWLRNYEEVKTALTEGGAAQIPPMNLQEAICQATKNPTGSPEQERALNRLVELLHSCCEDLREIVRTPPAPSSSSSSHRQASSPSQMSLLHGGSKRPSTQGGSSANSMITKEKMKRMACIIKICKLFANSNQPLSDTSRVKVTKVIRLVLVDRDVSIRSQGFRTLRSLIVDPESIEVLHGLFVPIFVMRSLERSSTKRPELHERMETLKLLRRIMEVEPTLVPKNLVRSLVAICGHREDHFRRVCLETLRELAVTNTEVVAQCDGLSTLFDAVLDSSCAELAESIILTLLLVLNEPTLRHFVRPVLDMQILLGAFTDTDYPSGSGSDRKKRWNCARTAIVTMMRTWPGVLLLASEPHGLSSLVQLLPQPVDKEIHKAVLDTFSDILMIGRVGKRGSSGSQEGSVAGGPYGASGDVNVSGSKNSAAAPLQDLMFVTDHNLLDNFLVVVCMALLHCGLAQALIIMGMDNNKTNVDVAPRATELLMELMKLASRLFPDKTYAKLMAVPALVDVAATSMRSSLQWERSQSMKAAQMLRHLASTVNCLNIVQIPPTCQNGAHLAAELMAGTNRVSNNGQSLSSQGYCRSSRQRLVYQLKVAMDAQMSRQEMNNMLERSKVLKDKDYLKWDWNVITDLLEGPLTNPARLSEVLKTNKFIKRVSGFFRCDPGDKGYFAHMWWIPDHVPYLRTACTLYTLLLHNSDGQDFLLSDRRGKICEMISNEMHSTLEHSNKNSPRAHGRSFIDGSNSPSVSPRNSSPNLIQGINMNMGARLMSQQSLFSLEGCSRQMVREYFTLLGLMSSSPQGLQMMSNAEIFGKYLNQLAKRQDLDYVSRLVLVSLDYTIDGPSRRLLQIWMGMPDSTSLALRLYTVTILRALMRADVPDFLNWGVDQLVTLLHDPHDSVVELVLSVLDEASKSRNFLDEIVMKVDLSKVVKLQHLPAAHNLLLRFVSTAYGCSCLEGIKWLSTAMEEWYVEEHMKYVHVLEGAITEALHKNRPSANGGSPSAYYDNDLGLGRPSTGSTGRGSPITPAKPVPVPVHVPLANFNERPKMKNKKGKSNGMAAWSLEWLFRLPWNIKVLVQNSSGNAPVDLTIDTYVDASQLRPEEHFSSDQADHHNSIIVKGVVLNAQGLPSSCPVDPGKMLKSALFLGIRPVDKNGFTQPEPQNKGGFYVSRRNSVSASPGGDTRGKSVSDFDDSAIGGGGTRDMYQYGSGVASNGPETDIQWCRCTHDDRLKQMSIVGEHIQKDFHYQRQQQQAMDGQYRENLNEMLEAYGKSNCVYYPSTGEFHICGLNQRAKWIFEATREDILQKRTLKLKSIEMVLDLLPQRPAAVPLRSHLYSELAKTETGCDYLKKSGHVMHFIETAMDIKKHLNQLDGQLPSSLLARRAALWSVGHIASSDTGFALLEECFTEIVQKYGEPFMRKLCNVSAMETEAEMQWRNDQVIKIPEGTGDSQHPDSKESRGSGNTSIGLPRLRSRPSNVAANMTFGIHADQIVDDVNLGVNRPVAGVNPLFSGAGDGGGGVNNPLLASSNVSKNMDVDDLDNLDNMRFVDDLDDCASRCGWVGGWGGGATG